MPASNFLHIVSYGVDRLYTVIISEDLGVPLHFEKLRREDLQPLLDSLLSRMAGWRGKLVF
jgi:hypothetical protein